MKVAAVVVTTGMIFFLHGGNKKRQSGIAVPGITAQTNNIAGSSNHSNEISAINKASGSLQKSFSDTLTHLANGLFTQTAEEKTTDTARVFMPGNGGITHNQSGLHGIGLTIPKKEPYQQQGSVTGQQRKSLTVNNHPQSAFANGNHQRSSSVNNYLQPASANGKRRQPSTVSDHPQPASANGQYQQALPGNDQSAITTGQPGINLTTLPLRSEKLQALMHTDMRVTVPGIIRKGGTSVLKNGRIWLQLNVPIPIYGSKYYFTGPKGNDAFYRNLIPSLRIEKIMGRSSLSIDLHPFTTKLLPLRAAANRPDSSPASTIENHMVKQFGSEITLQYHYPVYRNWHVSAGIEGSWWQQAIIRKTKIDTISSVTTIVAATKDDWKGYSRFTFSSIIELYYDTPKWQMGLRTAVPLNKYTGRRLQMEFLLRRRIKW